MHINKSLVVFLLYHAVAEGGSKHSRGCGDADACVLTETCSTVTRTSTYPTCVPTPTCLTVYQDCESGGSGMQCCSGYCAATKCRPTDPDWPNCKEDLGVCESDAECCYDNKCVEGLCRRG